MSRWQFFGFLIAGFASAFSSVRAEEGLPVIGEVVASNNNGIEDEDGTREDWIELLNPNEKEIDLGGWTIGVGEQQSILPDGLSIPAFDRLLIFASGKNRLTVGLPLHADFKLKAAGGTVTLTNRDNREVKLTYPELTDDLAWGLVEEEGENPPYAYFSTPTPLESNTGFHAAGLPAPEVVFSHRGGICKSPVKLELSLQEGGNEQGVQIYYRLDAQAPTATDQVYQEPIIIESNQTVRARAIAADRLPGRISGSSFVFVEPGLLERFSSNLPIVAIDTHGRYLDDGWDREYRPVFAMVFDTDEESGRAAIGQNIDFAGFSAMHVRGQTSASNFQKKQYAWEIRDAANQNDDAGILGLSPATDWILHAPFSDKTLMRNVLAYDTARRMAGSQAGVRTRYVDVFVNQNGDNLSAADYQGTYVLMERIERGKDRVDIAELTPFANDAARLQGGYIFKIDKQIYEHPTFYTRREGHEFGIVEPKEPSRQQQDYLRSLLDALEETLYSDQSTDPQSGYAKYVDVDAFIDLHWMVEVFREIDGFRYSSFYAKDRGRKVRPLPVWDYNLSLGNANYGGGEYPTGWYARRQGSGPWYYQMFRDPAFTRRYWERYFELRRGLFATRTFMDRIDAYAEEINESKENNFRRWPILGRHIWPNAQGSRNRFTYRSELEWMKNWLAERLQWIDSQSPHPPVFSNYGGAAADGEKLVISRPDNSKSGVIYYTLDGSDPVASPIKTYQVIADCSKLPLEVFVPTSVNGGDRMRSNDWTTIESPANAEFWLRGQGMVGYDVESNGTYKRMINVDLEREMFGRATACYIRVPFDLDPEIELPDRVALQMKVDDGFVAYLNGTRISYSNAQTSGVSWNSTALGSVADTGAIEWQDFDISRYRRRLKPGKNILAIHGLNRGADSSDALWAARIVGVAEYGGGASSEAWTYLKPIPIEEPVTVRAAMKFESGWSPTTSAVFIPGAKAASGENVVIDSIHYHPSAPTDAEREAGALSDDYEFIALKNTCDAVIDLSGWRFSHGVDFVFRSLDPADVSLAPGEIGVIVRDSARFQERHGKLGFKVMGQYLGYLSNGGERLSLEDGSGTEIVRIDYGDSKPWPKDADGDGSWLRFTGEKAAHAGDAEYWGAVDLTKPDDAAE